jgi:murein tripeptide amidase MpaA
MRISSQFDSGSIEVAQIAPDIQLRLRPDRASDPAVLVRQWFHFRLQGARGQSVNLRIVNAASATFAQGWENYRACASYDRERWFRVDTRYEAGELVIEHRPERDSVYYAYFEPYSWERHLRLLGRAEDSPLARVRDLGETLEGRDLNAVEIASGAGPRQDFWIIARQHPGETMAEWLAEGLIERLLEAGDPVSQRLLEKARFHIVPNMNPDGSVGGNLRVNTAGANLNREWMAPSLERSPEVFRVRAAIEASGCDFFIDAHGDETIPYVFCAGSEMLPSMTPAQKSAQDGYLQALVRAAPDFQLQHGYAAGRYSEDALKLASKWIGHRYGCVSLTLEMPFKDNFNRPDSRAGWNGERSRQLGRQLLDALAATMAQPR